MSASTSSAQHLLYSIDTYGELRPFVDREWLIGNGAGAFAMGTIVGCNTRRYHGLLCSALHPPVGRVMSLSRLGEILYLDDKFDRWIELSVNQFRGNIHPRGDQYLRKFHLGQSIVWEYEVDGAKVTKELRLGWKKNITGIRYRVDPGNAGRKARLDLLPFTGLRDFHSLRRSGARFDVKVEQGHVEIGDGYNRLFLSVDQGAFREGQDWWYGHWYPIETDRGQDDSEDLFTPGRFTVEANGPFDVTLWASPQPLEKLPDWDAFLQERIKARAAVAKPVAIKKGAPARIEPAADRSDTIKRLFRAADDFVVSRKAPDGSDGTSVLAGYPWFADWGRDTFISLPGLLLYPGRFDEARQVLKVFGEYVSEGMIPNRFDDYTSVPSYNTVDASLWYIHAAFEYLRFTGDTASFEQFMRPACRKIIDGYRQGTRFHIRMEEDGLITQGDYNTQLTWMDAKCGGVAFTPRQGKPVEINALWYNALVLMGETELAAKVKESFQKAFWISPERGLADGVNEGRQDTLLRPNQIFAVSLPNSPLTLDQQKAVVDVVRRELLTPVGLRTLARGEPGYRAWYGGPQMERDACYHNGIVWPWPIGGFLEAYLKVNGQSADAVDQAKKWLEPLIEHMQKNCIGQIAEIFEAEEPHRPVGCPAQAWSVAEVLRLAMILGM